MNSTHVQPLPMRIQAGSAWLDASLHARPDARALCLILSPDHATHPGLSAETGSAQVHQAGFNGLRANLLTPYEHQRDPDLFFDIVLQTQRLRALLAWVSHQPGLSALPLGIIASASAAAACIRELAQAPGPAFALVSIAGRPDLAGAEPLRRLQTPALMQVPEHDSDLLHSSQQAFQLIQGEKQWQTFVSDSQKELPEHNILAALAWLRAHLPAIASAQQP